MNLNWVKTEACWNINFAFEENSVRNRMGAPEMFAISGEIF